MEYLFVVQTESNSFQVLYTPADHTGENLKEALLETLQFWGLLSSSMKTISTDNGVNIVKVCELASFTWIPCFGHRYNSLYSVTGIQPDHLFSIHFRLHLAVTNALKDEPLIELAIKCCRRLIAHFNHSAT